MLSNYPPGAANDPNAPYNEVPEPETEVTVTETLTKAATVFGVHTHIVDEWEYDPVEGRNVHFGFSEVDGDVTEAFREQCDSAYDIIQKCRKICEQLKKDFPREYRYGGVNFRDLSYECLDWEQEELTVE